MLFEDAQNYFKSMFHMYSFSFIVPLNVILHLNSWDYQMNAMELMLKSIFLLQVSISQYHLWLDERKQIKRLGGLKNYLKKDKWNIIDLAHQVAFIIFFVT